MRHRVAGKQLSRTTSHRKALRRNLAAALLEHGTIRTTLTKAKEVRPFVEKLITAARKGTLHARRRVIRLLQDRAIVDEEYDNAPDAKRAGRTVVARLFDEIAPRYTDRPGGYTRIIHLPERRIGDAGEQVLLQLVEETAPVAEGETVAPASRRRRRAARRAEAVKSVEEETAAAADEEPESELAAEAEAENEDVAEDEGEAADDEAESEEK